MKQPSFLKRFAIVLLALLMALSLLLTGCSAEEVDLAIDIADAVLDMALEEGDTPPPQTDKTPESSQAPPVEPAPPVEVPVETPAETPVTEETPAEPPAEEAAPEETIPDEDGRYTSPEDVAAYIHHYGKLPKNFISKNKAKDLGWDSSKGNLWDVTDEMSIGGDRFGNYEGKLPDAEGRTWKECDVNYAGGYRGAERLLYSNDGLIFYTDDHYESFTQLY